MNSQSGKKGAEEFGYIFRVSGFATTCICSNLDKKHHCKARTSVVLGFCKQCLQIFVDIFNCKLEELVSLVEAGKEDASVVEMVETLKQASVKSIRQYVDGILNNTSVKARTKIASNTSLFALTKFRDITISDSDRHFFEGKLRGTDCSIYAAFAKREKIVFNPDEDQIEDPEDDPIGEGERARTFPRGTGVPGTEAPRAKGGAKKSNKPKKKKTKEITEEDNVFFNLLMDDIVEQVIEDENGNELKGPPGVRNR